MSKIFNLFGKNIEDLELEDIVNYFNNPKEESDVIEYKSYHVQGQNNHKHKESAILKTVCAFLNSNGGILIWGAPTEQLKADGSKYYEGNLSPVQLAIRKDDFIAKIVNKIVPSANGVLLKVIEIAKNECLLIIDVATSAYKPHRLEGRYWMRLDGQSKVAPHHFVEAQFKQIRYPNLEGYIKVTGISKYLNNHAQDFQMGIEYIKIGISTFIFNFSGLINEENLSYRIVCDIGQFSTYRSPAFRNNHFMNGFEYRNLKAKEVLHYGEPLTENFILLIHPDSLFKKNYMMELYLSFGGRKSPQKRSMYKLNLAKWEGKEFNDLFVEINENKTAYESSLELGKSKEEVLKGILGR